MLQRYFAPYITNFDIGGIKYLKVCPVFVPSQIFRSFLTKCNSIFQDSSITLSITEFVKSLE